MLKQLTADVVAVMFCAGIAISLATAASEMLPINGTHCSFGADSEGYGIYPFEIGPNGYSDEAVTCDVVAVENIGDGWMRVKESCAADGQKSIVSLDIKVSGDRAVAVLEDGHQYSLRRCE